MTTDEIISFIKNMWVSGRKTKRTDSGWISGNAPCCVNRGESRDKRMRGGLNVSNYRVSYSCFNCKFKASWRPGSKLSKNMSNLLLWMGASNKDIDHIRQVSLNLELPDDYEPYVPSVPVFSKRSLPNGTNLLSERNRHGDAKEIYDYAKSRGLIIEGKNYFWCRDPYYARRLIIPYIINETLVGWTARAIDKGTEPKYIASYQTGFVFNYDAQKDDRQFCVLVEGEIDAIKIDGMALKGSSVSDSQHELLKLLDKKIIVVPDRDSQGVALMESALSRGYHVSMPMWDDDIKDVDDAVTKYGRLFTLYSILNSATKSKLQARVRAKQWERKKAA